MKQYKNLLILTGFIFYSYYKNKNRINYELFYSNNNKTELIIDKINLKDNYFNFSNSKLQIIEYLLYEFSFAIVNFFNECYLCNIKNTYKIEIDKDTNIYFEIFSTIPNNDKIIILNHGLTDSSGSLLLKKIEYYNNEGYDVAIFWRRGHYNNLTNNIIVNDSSEDLDKIIINLVDEKYYKNIFLYAVSAGTITVYKYLVGNYKYKNYIKGAILKSPSFNIIDDLNSLAMVFHNILKKKILYLVKRIKNHNYNINETWSLIDILIHITSINQGKKIDNLSEFNIDFNLYKNNNIPLLILVSKDDPITKYNNIGNLKNIVLDSKNMILVITKFGHHTLWISKNKDKDSFNELIVKFIKNLS